VRPDLRGRGIGSALFDRALRRAGGRVVGLDGVPAQQESYERRGFVLAHRNVRWRTVGGGHRPTGLVELSSVPFGQLLAFDAAVFGAERARFLRVWIDRSPGHALACVREGSLAGYGVLRPCRRGAKVGPLLADDEEVAETLLAGLIAAAGPGGEVFIDMPDANPRARSLRADREMDPSFETARMYLNGRPPEDVQRVFGVTTLEFG
jgi:Acetyltransferase (GNAT) domain